MAQGRKEAVSLVEGKRGARSASKGV